MNKASCGIELAKVTPCCCGPKIWVGLYFTMSDDLFENDLLFTEKRINGVMLPKPELCFRTENGVFSKKHAPKIEVPAPRRARYRPALLKYENITKKKKTKTQRNLRFLPRGERDMARPFSNKKSRQKKIITPDSAPVKIKNAKSIIPHPGHFQGPPNPNLKLTE